MKVLEERYFRTRTECILHVRGRLLDHVRANRRVFVGFDFAYGYPAGFAAALDVKGDAPAWRFIWDELSGLIEDNERNANNRFEVANEFNARCAGAAPGSMWACPPGKVQNNLTATKSAAYLYETKSGLRLEEL